MSLLAGWRAWGSRWVLLGLDGLNLFFQMLDLCVKVCVMLVLGELHVVQEIISQGSDSFCDAGLECVGRVSLPVREKCCILEVESGCSQPAAKLLEECSKDCIAGEKSIGLNALGNGTKLMCLPFVIEDVDNGDLLHGDICNAILHGPCCSLDCVSEVVWILPLFWFSW